MGKKYTIWLSLFVIPLLYAVVRWAPRDWRTMLAFGLHWGLAAIVLVWANTSLQGPRDIGLRRAFTGFICFVLIVAGYCFGLTAWFGSQPLAGWQWAQMYGLGRSGYMAIAISAGFCEEVIYRGYMMTALKKVGQPAWVAMVLSSLSFVFFHGILPLPMMLAGFIIAMIWAAIYHTTSILWVTVYFHALWDATVILVPWGSLSSAS